MEIIKRYLPFFIFGALYRLIAYDWFQDKTYYHISVIIIAGTMATIIQYRKVKKNEKIYN